jgi:hypothetical protein
MAESCSGFENAEPIDDVLVALDLLCKRWGDCTLRILHAPDKRAYLPHGPFIEVVHTHEHSASTTRFYRVTEHVTRRLIAGRLVHGTPQWGYTDESQLCITESGEEMLWNARKKAALDDRLTSTLWLRRRAHDL